MSRKVLALRTRYDGPKVHVKRADRIIVSGLGDGDCIALHSGDRCLIKVSAPGVYELRLRDQNLYVKRITGNSLFDVFAEH